MAIYLALLRAVGPATHPKMPMAKLREAVADAGFGRVSTVGNTGNVLLTSRPGAAKVRDRVQEAVDGFGVNCEVFVRNMAEVGTLLEANPFPRAAADHPNAVGVCFFHAAPRWPGYGGPETVVAIGNHLVIDYGGRVTGSSIAVERRTNATMTQRSWSSLVKIAANGAASAN